MKHCSPKGITCVLVVAQKSKPVLDGGKINAISIYQSIYILARMATKYIMHHLGRKQCLQSTTAPIKKILAQAKQWLQEVSTGKQMKKRVGGAGKRNCKRDDDRSLPTYIQSMWRRGEHVGYKFHSKKHFGTKVCCHKDLAMQENLELILSFRNRVLGQL